MFWVGLIVQAMACGGHHAGEVAPGIAGAEPGASPDAGPTTQDDPEPGAEVGPGVGMGASATSGSEPPPQDDPAPPDADTAPDDAGAADDDGEPDAAVTEVRSPDAGCLAGVDDYSLPGPFARTATQSGPVRLWVPDVPAGCKVPMIHVSNGTGATCSFYEGLLLGLASHGFLTLCYESPNTGNGSHGVEAFETALNLYPDVADLKFGSAGHATGGQGALTSLMLSEARWGAEGFYAGFGISPESGFGNQPDGGTWRDAYAAIRAPVLSISGNPTDGLVSRRWVQDGHDALDDGTEAYHFSWTDLVHFDGSPDAVSRLALLWFRWKLLGDQDACEALKSVPATDPDWEVAAVQNETPCRPN